jgi:hypothetical protein
MALVTERPIVVDRATVLEWPQIEALRLAYFEARDQSVQRRTPDVLWWVARRGERVVGAFSTYEAEELNQRVILDFYRVPGKNGTRAIKAMYATIFADADHDEVDIVGTIDPANEPQLRAVLGRQFSPVGIVCLRRYRCPQQ